MRIHEAGQQDVLRQADMVVRREMLLCLRGGEEGMDAAVVHGERMIFMHQAGGFDGQDPPGFYEEIDRLHGPSA